MVVAQDRMEAILHSIHIGNVMFVRFFVMVLRDPKVEETLSVYNSAANWIKTTKLKEQDLEEAKLSIFQDIDAPIPPSRRGIAEFASKLTFPIRQT